MRLLIGLCHVKACYIMTSGSAGWLAGWLADWLAGWLGDALTNITGLIHVTVPLIQPNMKWPLAFGSTLLYFRNIN